MSWKPNKETTKLLSSTQTILNEYGDLLTFKQLYYRMVSCGYLDNSISSYRKLTRVVGQARKHGRFPSDLFVSPSLSDHKAIDLDEYLRETVNNYSINKTVGQSSYVEVWVEKPAVYDFMYRLLSPFDIPVFLSQGYSSYSFTHQAYQRILRATEAGRVPRIVCFFDLCAPSFNIFDSSVRELAALFDVSPDEMRSVMFLSAVLPEHVIKFSLHSDPSPVKDTRYSSYVEFFGSMLSVAGLSTSVRYEVESINPFELRDLTYRSVFSIMDYSQVLDLQDEEVINRSKLQKLIEALNM